MDERRLWKDRSDPRIKTVDDGYQRLSQNIRKYPTEKERKAKRKILIVDDSVAIRQRIRELLSKSYDVSEAGSGVAAIRSIALDRPDLVLLDHEMPVCNGLHMLEMFRSEEDLADIPVIFLTCRDDKEIVKKVLALNVVGYLLKYLNPMEIKKRIDEHFKRRAL